MKRNIGPESIAWEHFRESEDQKDEVICDYCGERLKRGGDTSNMLKHIQRKHPTLLPEESRSRQHSCSRSRSSSPLQYLQQELDEEEEVQKIKETVG